MTLRTRWIHWIMLAVLTVSVVAGCAAPPPPMAAGPAGGSAPAQEPTATSTPIPEADWRALCTELVNRSQEPLEINGEIVTGEEIATDYFVPDRVMITGDPEEIETLIGIAAEEGRDFGSVINDPIGEPIELSWFQAARGQSELLQSYFAPDDKPEMRLYATEGNTAGVACMLRGVQQEDGVRAYAELNYLIGPRPHPTEGSPFGSVRLDADPGAFAAQPAFGLIDLLDLNHQCQSEERDVHVAVFDTSPFLTTTVVDSQPGPFTLTVTDYVSGLPPLSPMHTSAPLPAHGVADHGLFVSALIHAVAADSNIELFRVLDDQGRGMDTTLADALTNYLTIALTQSDGAALEGTVINLSLGLHYPPYFLRNAVGAIDIVRLLTPLSIRYHLIGARALGAIVVAAAGNEATPEDTMVPSPQLPAPWADFAVAAVDNIGNRACYSNNGAIAAPGGANCTGDEIEDPSLCTASDCPYGIMSRMEASSTGYGWWAGTSFATALVSGMAARYLEIQDPGTDEWLSPDAVRVMISTTVTSVLDAPSVGMIQVKSTCLPD